MISRNKRRRSSLRGVTRLIEQLEARTLLSADWRNPANPHDVNHDTYVTPIDALIIINDLNRGGPSELGPRPNEEVPTLPYFDVNGDGHRAPLDVLLIINELNRTAKVPVFRINEGQSFSAELTNLISLGQSAGARTVRLEIAATFDTSDSASLLKDTFQIYLVDPVLKSQTILDRGEGTALFSMNENGADYQPGRVRFDGTVVEIDVTPLE